MARFVHKFEGEDLRPLFKKKNAKFCHEFRNYLKVRGSRRVMLSLSLL